MRLILCDRSTAVVPVNRGTSRDGAFIIHLSSVVTALNELSTWSGNVPPRWVTPRPPHMRAPASVISHS